MLLKIIFVIDTREKNMSFIYHNYPNYKLDLLMRQLATAILLWCVLYLPG